MHILHSVSQEVSHYPSHRQELDSRGGWPILHPVHSEAYRLQHYMAYGQHLPKMGQGTLTVESYHYKGTVLVNMNAIR